MDLHLNVTNGEAIAILSQFPDDQSRNEYALKALTVGLTVLESLGPQAEFLDQVLYRLRPLIEDSAERTRHAVLRALAHDEGAETIISQTPAKGVRFEEQVVEALQRLFAAEDMVEPTGAKPGRGSNAKVGDAVVTLGPERHAPGCKVVQGGY